MEGAKRREGQEEVGLREMGPENESPVSCGQDFGFYYESNEKSLHGLKQGSIMIGLTFQEDHLPGGKRARGEAESERAGRSRLQSFRQRWWWHGQEEVENRLTLEKSGA